MKYRVAFDNHVFRMQKRGGASRYFLELANYLGGSADFEARIVAPIHFSEMLKGDPIFSRGNLFLKHSGSRFGFARSINLLSDFGTKKMIRQFKPNLVHETYYKSQPLWDQSTPSICTILDFTREIIDGNMQKLERKIETANRASNIICISESTRNDLLKFAPGLAHKTVITPLGCSKVFLEQQGKQLGFNRPFVLYVGQRRGYKNFSLLLQAIASLIDFRDSFDLIAFGGGPFTRAEREELEILGLQNMVKHESGDDQFLSSYYRSALCFIYPSLYEGFGLPILEALASGCRVICSNTSSFPEVGIDLVEYFDPADLQSLRRAMENVLQSNNISEDWKFRAHAHALEYTWEKVGYLTVNEYLKVLD